MSKFFAVFAIARDSHTPQLFAGTTRAADRGEAGKVGLPGGKVDAGETAIQALFRESEEEGWELAGEPRLVRSAFVEGKLVGWFEVESARKLSVYKEQGRIRPIALPLETLAASGYGNEFLSYHTSEIAAMENAVFSERNSAKY